ncbi:MAG: BadF/BadG/BcrA/BcrD ATPase family protein [Bacteroidota bacterium]|nr:BadF/BadG/BcrA/BcrD ATPase family protein [Bacteroidota bacterium]
MKYLIGIDGGGTKTHCVLTDFDLNIIYECYGGPSNFLILGDDIVCNTLFNLIESCKTFINGSYDDIAYVVLGTTGAGRRNDAERLENSFTTFLETKNIVLNFRVESDARIALEAAFSGKPGSILIAGTGSIMFGKDASGDIHRVGGFGRYIGDEGSGYSIGKKGLIAVSKSFDGRSGHTLIADLVAEKFKISSPEILITEIYKNSFDIATVAPLVLKAAEMGDDTALKIINDETDELVLHIIAMQKKINEDSLFLAFVGGIICNENIYSKEFVEKITTRLPYVSIQQPDFPPELGAVLMAKELIIKN